MKLPRNYDPGWFILNDGGHPVKVHDLMTWAQWLEKNHKRRIVKQTRLADDIVLVSTVFLGLDHNHWRKGRRSFSRRWSLEWIRRASGPKPNASGTQAGMMPRSGTR